MTKETFALINNNNQVINHIVIDKDDIAFESNMADQLAHWNCVRYVETTEDEPVIIFDESPDIWTIHTEEDGFVIPVGYGTEIVEIEPEFIPQPEWDGSIVTINGRQYPTCSLLLKENAQYRDSNWTLPDGEAEVSLDDAE